MKNEERNLKEDYGFGASKYLALQSAILFNKIAHNGKSVSEYTTTELIDALNLQTDITSEECKEWQDFVDVDLVEELDAVVDIIYTHRYLEYLVKEFNSRNIEVADTLKLRRLQHTRTISEYIMNNVAFHSGIVLEATKRVIENNEQKFTKDSEEFAKWESSFSRKTVEVDGEYYYFLADVNGKVRKKENFEKVVLDDLVEKIVEKDNG